MARVEAGEQTAARVAYVSATDKWELLRDENGDPIIDLQEMQGLSLADPGPDQVETVLPDAAYQGAFTAWGAAHEAIAREWARLTDGKNLQPDVSQLVRDAREIVLDARSSLTTEERNRLAASIAQRWPRRISTRIREALNAGATDADKVMNLKRVAEEEGLQPPPPPKPKQTGCSLFLTPCRLRPHLLRWPRPPRLLPPNVQRAAVAAGRDASRISPT